MKHYEVYAWCEHESDLVCFDTLDEAIECAIKWSMEELDLDIVIHEVMDTKIKTYRNGGEVA